MWGISHMHCCWVMLGGGGSGVQYMYENGIICILSSAVSHMENMDDVFGVVRLSFVCRH